MKKITLILILLGTAFFTFSCETEESAQESFELNYKHSVKYIHNKTLSGNDVNIDVAIDYENIHNVLVHETGILNDVQDRLSIKTNKNLEPITYITNNSFDDIYIQFDAQNLDEYGEVISPSVSIYDFFILAGDSVIIYYDSESYEYYQ